MTIEIVESPSVYMVGRQVVDYVELDRFLDDEGIPGFRSDADIAGEELIEIAGRLCYMSFAHPRPGGNAKYIQHILEVGHGSVLEHEVFNLIITGVSRSLTHQLIRHRVGFSYSELSQRFVDSSDVAFVVPPDLIGCLDTEAGTVWQDACSWSSNRYRLLAQMMEGKASFEHLSPTDRRKAARQAARSVLPECAETKIFVTGNARAFRHFVELRGSEHADAEIRRLSHAVLGVLRKASPHVFGDYEEVEVETVSTLRTPHRKV